MIDQILDKATKSLDKDSVTNDKKLEKTFNPLDAYRHKSWYDYWLYNWIAPTMEYANNHKMTLEDLGKVSESESAKHHSNILSSAWYTQKEHKRYTILKCIWQCYKWPIFLTNFAVWSCLFIEVVNYHVLEYIMGYIDGEYQNQILAIAFCFLIAVIEIASRGFHMM
jgi:hypothetical protein